MNLVLLPCVPSSPFLSLSSSPVLTPCIKPPRSTFPRSRICAELPSRDRVIDFGKYKGRMLGTLPSAYLKWVSNNLRARDYEDWAKLADQVLQDPYYKDRLEWEHAERILQGDESRSTSMKPVADLLEVSERFGWDNDDKIGWDNDDKIGWDNDDKIGWDNDDKIGWDNDDKIGWKRIDFTLLGTSKGGRIPRIRDSEGTQGKGLPYMEKNSKGHQEIGSGDEGFKYRRETRMGDIEMQIIKRNRRSGVDLSCRTSGSMKTEGNSKVVMEPWIVETKKVGYLKDGFRYYDVDEAAFEVENIKAKREERREKQRQKRALQLEKVKNEIGVKEDKEYGRGQSRTAPSNPFPGRESLLRKIHRQD